MDSEVLKLAEKQAELFRIFGNARRLYILWLLKEEELSVNQIADRVGSSLQNVSQHLGLLRRYGFVANRRDGQTIYYQISKLECFKQCPAMLKTPGKLE
jgi:DNA-binding transcriptional ArsR family regulator